MRRRGGHSADGQPMTISDILATLNRPLVTEQRGGVKWSFDDLHIGRIKTTGSSLFTREIERPYRVSTTEWYSFAGAVIRIMNHPTAAP